MRERTGAGRPWLLPLVLFALFASGVSSIVNQVVWQRGLKVFLGGSETLSSMVVVLVFMMGLGIGAIWAGYRIDKVRRPLHALALIELLLFIVNVIIAVVLGLDITDSVYAAQRLALAVGIPRQAVYAVGALLILLPPTILMGATLPVASEICQGQADERKTITYLFFINTVGAALGAFGASFYLLPYYGQRIALLIAAMHNLAAGACLLAFASKSALVRPARKAVKARGGAITVEESMGALLGFLSLGYEIYLFRVVVLGHGPLPYTFATTLCFFLLFWSLGVYLASFFQERIPALLVATACMVAAMPWIYELDRYDQNFRMFVGGLVYFLPCVVFGILYGHLVSRSAQEWGRDVGRFYAFNTAGSCAGILWFTLVGYEIQHHYNAFVIALGLMFSCGYYLARTATPTTVRLGRVRRLLIFSMQTASIATVVFLVVAGLRTPYTTIRGIETYWGRDGVAEIGHNQLFLDGLWHSELVDERGVVGQKYTWWMAVAGRLAHGPAPVNDALVVGCGLGITAATLALKEDLSIDAYEINHTLKGVIRAHPTATLHSASHPRINIIWQDGRSGLALNPKRYDLIISAPLHLKQSGSSLLLSREYLQLLKRRLKPGGVVVLYTHEGWAEQAQLVRNTVSLIFRHAASFAGGVITVASEAPMRLDGASLQEKLRSDDRLMKQALAHIRRNGLPYDGPFHEAGSYIVSDDHPLLEYPEIAAELVELPGP